MNINLKDNYPIGTICKINGYSELIMIIGYKKNTYGSIENSYDYEGCFYPFGTLTNVKLFFNKKEIVEVIFEGYKNEVDYNKKEEVIASKVEDINEKIYMEEDIYFVKNNVYNQLLFDKDGKVLIAEENKE